MMTSSDWFSLLAIFVFLKKVLDRVTRYSGFTTFG